MRAIVLFGLLAGFASEGAPCQAPPDEPEEPFTVFVLANAGNNLKDKNSPAYTIEEIKKKVKDRKKWFRLAEDRQEAEIVIELIDQGKTEDIVEREGPPQTSFGQPGGSNVTTVDRAVMPDLKRSYYLRARTTILEKFQQSLTATSEGGRRPADAAKSFAHQLERLCRRNYWTIVEKR